MSKAKRALPVTKLDTLARQILTDLLNDFLAQKLGADALEEGYKSLSLAELVENHSGTGTASQVDFDLAIKQLEEHKFIGTGPMVPYENIPDSDLIFIGLVNKREYCFLTEEGYRAARKSQQGFERF